MQIMKFRRSLFWDVEPETIDEEKHARYIIERVLDFGTDKEAGWMYRRYPHTLIRSVLDRSRVLHPQTRALWNELVPK